MFAALAPAARAGATTYASGSDELTVPADVTSITITASADEAAERARSPADPARRWRGRSGREWGRLLTLTLADSSVHPALFRFS